MDPHPTLPTDEAFSDVVQRSETPSAWAKWGRRLGKAVGLVVLAGCGLAVGAAGPFVAREVYRLGSAGGLPVPYGLLLVVLATGGLFHVGGKLFGRAGAVVPVLTWAVPVVAMLLPRPEGDIVLADDGYGLVFLLVGVILAAWSLGRAISAPGRGDGRAPSSS